jgi:hypothetical protein
MKGKTCRKCKENIVEGQNKFCTSCWDSSDYNYKKKKEVAKEDSLKENNEKELDCINKKLGELNLNYNKDKLFLLKEEYKTKLIDIIETEEYKNYKEIQNKLISNFKFHSSFINLNFKNIIIEMLPNLQNIGAFENINNKEIAEVCSGFGGIFIHKIK